MYIRVRPRCLDFTVISCWSINKSANQLVLQSVCLSIVKSILSNDWSKLSTTSNPMRYSNGMVPSTVHCFVLCCYKALTYQTLATSINMTDFYVIWIWCFSLRSGCIFDDVLVRFGVGILKRSHSHHNMTNDLAFFAANRLEAVPADTNAADALVDASLQTWTKIQDGTRCDRRVCVYENIWEYHIILIHNRCVCVNVNIT